jgi:hypothetical protein
VARLSKYQKRKRAGKREWTKFQKYRFHYQHLATLFSGFALCGGFLLVMGFVRGYDTTLEIVAAYSLTAFTGLMLSAREYFVIKSSWRWWKLMVN